MLQSSCTSVLVKYFPTCFKLIQTLCFCFFLIDYLDFETQMDDDQISALPDEIICHILSFLTSEEVFTTNVLSKRWRPLWRLVPNLDFDDRRCSVESCSRFINMVYVTIYARSVHRPIKRFNLICDGSSIYETQESDVVIG